MIEVDVYLVISTFIIDIKLFVAINGVFIPFVSNGALQRDKNPEFEIHSNSFSNILWAIYLANF